MEKETGRRADRQRQRGKKRKGESDTVRQTDREGANRTARKIKRQGETEKKKTDTKRERLRQTDATPIYFID